MFFVWTLYLMLTATSDIRCSSMSSTVFWRVTPVSGSYGSLFARASNSSTLHLIRIHPLPRERKLKRNHVMVGRLLQNSTTYICMQQSIYWFNFNTGYFHSTTIFIQLQHGLFLCKTKYLFNFSAQSYVLWNEYIYSTSTKKYFHSTKHIYSTLQVPGHR